ncbi:MAG: hypothetical protein M1838_001682 [Thelocarpon superellum]|nr:MAG: hypothetical protein M1838_001682 [Thelocarpon superellum]
MAVPEGTGAEDEANHAAASPTESAEIVANGDLRVELEGGGKNGAPLLVRVDRAHLRKASRYFHVLLDSHKFAEGSALQDRHDHLRSQGVRPADGPNGLLPRIRIGDTGRMGPCPEGIGAVTLDFFRVLHGLPMQRPRHSVAFLANAVILADRFDSLPVLSAYIKAHRLFPSKDPIPGEVLTALAQEQRDRQRLLICTLLDHPSWFGPATGRLVAYDYDMRHATSTAKSVARSAVAQGLWWSLPDELEAELLHRRECILETLHSLQVGVMESYMSRIRQCTLGYDSSVQCDDFQLGQAVRFFNRIGTLRMSSNLYDSGFSDPFMGNVKRLIANLRQFPPYQIDGNHAHCGPRTKLIPALDFLQTVLARETDMCWTCWRQDRANYRWSDVEPARHWRLESDMAAWKGQRCRESHRQAKAMFTALHRVWNEAQESPFHHGE